MKTVKFLGSVAAAVLVTGVAQADLLINEVVDGDLPGGHPKWVELRNTGLTTVDPTTFAIANYNNGNTTPGGGSSTPLVGGTLAAGGYYIISYEYPGTANTYSSVYSGMQQPDLHIGPFTNGDDVLSLEDLGGTFVDQYGELGVDGTGEVWEYMDGYSFRAGTVANGGTWDAGDWVYGGVKSLEDEVGGVPAKIALLQTLTSPGVQTTYITTGPDNYCTAGTSTSGCKAIISAAGQASTTASTGFVVSVTGAEGQKDGLFFYGQNGKQANAWGNGTSLQCVVTPVKRGGLQGGTGTVGACDGIFSQDLNARWCPTCPKWPGHAPAPGKMQIQFWHRDPLNTSNQTTSLSDAIEVDVL